MESCTSKQVSAISVLKLTVAFMVVVCMVVSRAEAVTVRLTSGKVVRGPVVGIDTGLGNFTLRTDQGLFHIKYEHVGSISKGLGENDKITNRLIKSVEERQRSIKNFRRNPRKESRRRARKIDNAIRESQRRSGVGLRNSRNQNSPISKQLQKRLKERDRLR